MYYILVLVLAIVLFVLFLKALGAVIKGLVTTLFVMVVVVGAIIMYRSIKAPVILLGRYKVEKFVVTRIN